ncbi:hypothetical protein HZB02_01410 [Candidatus Woesearchaeota archaeon]|nr:hypothetical protein [Candidatus Woesearchaeota archaeon]
MKHHPLSIGLLLIFGILMSIVSAEASIILISPLSNETVTDNTPTFYVSTSEPASCRWDYFDGASTSMAYNMTGSLITHNYTFSEVLRDNMYSLYARCMNASEIEPLFGTLLRLDIDTRSNFGSVSK